MHMPPSVLAVDIGGAHLKAAHSGGMARTHAFELWKQPAGLPPVLGKLIATLPAFDLLAVTMTGELCDCFATKREGVLHILRCVEEAAPAAAKVRVWRTDATWADLGAARTLPLLCAASNWLALATFSGRFAPEGSAVLLDIGSTTTDIIPLVDGRPTPTGRTDAERLRSGELVYTGARRTPVCALLGAEGAAEWFATTLDVYLVLDLIAEDRDDGRTADGRPATRPHAHARLARMLGADAESCAQEETLRLANLVRDRQLGILRAALGKVTARLLKPPPTVVLSGSGEFLGRLVCRDTRLISLAEELGVEASQAACATALARLAAEHFA
jgi:probable H4MPT-linked C1 transfer pathway protein